jgi:SAM-dependent methyltransferase
MPAEPKRYLDIVQHYEACLDRHGDTHLGVDWPKKEDATRRYQVMLEVVRRASPAEEVTLLDFGCGAAHLREHIAAAGAPHIRYSGLDLSPKFIALSRQKFPADDFYCLDILDDDDALPTFDYIVMNGVFTEKRGLSFDEMLSYFKRMLRRIWPHARRGIAFNVMSKQVDWERDDLFHMPLDTLAGFLVAELSRDFIVRNDYQLYEYTTYVYRR